MNRNARKWVDALRSGAYRQTTGRLRREDWTMCCLGIACDVFNKETGVGEWKYLGPVEQWDFRIDRVDGSNISLPAAVVHWLGLRSCRGDWGPASVGSSLASKNDDGMSFDEIAELIESQVDLFVAAGKLDVLQGKTPLGASLRETP